nr:pentatricopeptide repeat-containing protein At5g04810, chloroplastic [Ipomoea batatas]
MFSLSCSQHPPFSASILTGKHHTTATSSAILSFNSSSGDLSRDTVHKPLKISYSENSKLFLKNSITSTPTPPSVVTPPQNVDTKLCLSSEQSPPAAPQDTSLGEYENGSLGNSENSDSDEKDTRGVEFREKGKIFVGNLPLWIKKNELAELFGQFGHIKDVILIRGHHETDRNMGFGFVIYGGSSPEKTAIKAVQLDGVEFHGRVLTVKLDDGRRIMKDKNKGRTRWMEGSSSRNFRKVLESQPENWHAVVRAFERINKPSRKEFGMMVNYYGRRGDKHRAREMFEKMRSRGIVPTSYEYTNLTYAYTVSRDMEEALTCVRKMKDEGIEISVVTYSIIVGGFAKVGNVE